MDRFLLDKSHQNEFAKEKSKPHKKRSHRKQSCDDQGVLPSHQSRFPASSQNDGPGFKKLGKNFFGAAPGLKGASRPKFHPKAKNYSVKKILGKLCGSPLKSRLATKRSRGNNSPASSNSSASSSSQAEHQSYHRVKKTRKQNEENFQQEYENDGEYRRNENVRLKREDDYRRRYLKERKDEGDRRGDYFPGNIENQPRKVAKTLTFLSSESEEESSLSLLHKGHLSPRCNDRVSDIIAEDEVLRESSQTVLIADDIETSKSPVLLKTSKPFMSDQDLWAEYTELGAAVTDVLTMEQQNYFHGKSYIETVTQNLLNVFLERGKNNSNVPVPEKESDGNHGIGTSIFEGLDFVTPATSIFEAGGPIEQSLDFRFRKNREREMERMEVPPPKETRVFGAFPKDGHISVSKENSPADIFFQFKPNPPEKKLAKHVEEPSPDMPLSFQQNLALWSPSTDDYMARKSSEELTFMKDVRDIDKERTHQRKDTAKPAKCGPNQRSYGEGLSRPPKRTYNQCLFSPQPIFPENDDVLDMFSRRPGNPESSASRYHNTRETERSLSRRTCTATSSTSIDYCLFDVSSPLLREQQSCEEVQTPFLNEVVKRRRCEEDHGFYRQREPTGDGTLRVDLCGRTRGSGSTDFVESSQKESFLNSVGLLSNMKDVAPENETWFSPPKFYRRRMF